jgi:hypothetical protein
MPEFGKERKKKFGEAGRARSAAAKEIYSLGPGTDDAGILKILGGIGGAVGVGIASGGNPAAIAAGYKGGSMLGEGIEGLVQAKDTGDFTAELDKSLGGIATGMAATGGGEEEDLDIEGAEDGLEGQSMVARAKARQKQYA